MTELITEITSHGPGAVIALVAVGYAGLTSLIGLNGRKSTHWR